VRAALQAIGTLDMVREVASVIRLMG